MRKQRAGKNIEAQETAARILRALPLFFVPERRKEDGYRNILYEHKCSRLR